MAVLGYWIIWVCLFCGVSSDKTGNVTFLSEEHRLLHTLMENYDLDIRPVRESSDRVAVHMGMALVNLEGLDEMAEVLHLTSWLRMSWNDIRLQWNPLDYGNVHQLRIDINKLWQPDIVLYNSRIDFSNAIHKTMAVVSNDGTVFWVPPMYTSSHCPIDLTGFPYDTQVCKLKFGSWTYSGKEITLSLFGGKNNSLDTENVNDHHEFEIAKKDSALNQKFYPCCPEPYPDITYTLELKRVRHSMNHMLVTPCILACFFLPVIFLLPPESDEKIFYGVGLFIGNCLLLMHIFEIIGFLHLVVPPLANYHLLNLALSCLALAISALIRNIWAKGRRGARLPVFVKEYFLGIFGRMMRVSRDAFMPVGGTQPDHIVRQRDVLGNEDEEVTKEDDREHILQNFAKHAQAAEWKQLAVTLDRLSFVVFFVICLITTIALMTK